MLFLGEFYKSYSPFNKQHFIAPPAVLRSSSLTPSKLTSLKKAAITRSSTKNYPTSYSHPITPKPYPIKRLNSTPKKAENTKRQRSSLLEMSDATHKKRLNPYITQCKMFDKFPTNLKTMRCCTLTG